MEPFHYYYVQSLGCSLTGDTQSIVAVFVFVCVWSPRGRARDRKPSVASLTGLYYGITLIAQIATTLSLSRV